MHSFLECKYTLVRSYHSCYPLLNDFLCANFNPVRFFANPVYVFLKIPHFFLLKFILSFQSINSSCCLHLFEKKKSYFFLLLSLFSVVSIYKFIILCFTFLGSTKHVIAVFLPSRFSVLSYSHLVAAPSGVWRHRPARERSEITPNQSLKWGLDSLSSPRAFTSSLS